jgi:hypothetical protein
LRGAIGACIILDASGVATGVSNTAVSIRGRSNYGLFFPVENVEAYAEENKKKQ